MNSDINGMPREELLHETIQVLEDALIRATYQVLEKNKGELMDKNWSAVPENTTAAQHLANWSCVLAQLQAHRRDLTSND